ncbi:hypothetical protein RDI58_008806 [Solanum bulbocastanum]|uniref:Uncharacterized protein n=1 Tax=Solanum bulbocastanum TaxID=147425 RepID=A0AAN8U2H0_SOLBU
MRIYRLIVSFDRMTKICLIVLHKRLEVIRVFFGQVFLLCPTIPHSLQVTFLFFPFPSVNSFLRSFFGGLPSCFLVIGGNTTSSKTCDGTSQVLSQGKGSIGIAYVS